MTRAEIGWLLSNIVPLLEEEHTFFGNTRTRPLLNKWYGSSPPHIFNSNQKKDDIDADETRAKRSQ